MATTTTPLHTFVLWAPDYTDEGAFARRTAVRGKHLEKARALLQEGRISWGSCAESIESADAEKKLVGSVLIVEAESLAAVRKFVEEDVYYTSNVWDKEKLVIAPVALLQ